MLREESGREEKRIQFKGAFPLVLLQEERLKLRVLSQTETFSACSPEVAILSPPTTPAPCKRGSLINLPRKKTRTIDLFSSAETLAPSSTTNRHQEKEPIGFPNEPKSGSSAANQAAEQQRVEDAPDSRTLIGYLARANQGVRLSFMGTWKSLLQR